MAKFCIASTAKRGYHRNQPSCNLVFTIKHKCSQALPLFLQAHLLYHSSAGALLLIRCGSLVLPFEIIFRLSSGVCKKLKDVFHCTHYLFLLGIFTAQVCPSGLLVCLWHIRKICVNVTPGVLGHLQSTYPLPRLQVASLRWMRFSALLWLP